MSLSADPVPAGTPAMSAPPTRGRWRGWFRGTALVPLLAVLLAFAVGSILILISSVATTGHLDPSLPFRAYGAMLEGAGITTDPDAIFSGLINTLTVAAPLVLGGLSVGIAFKAGLFNIGGFGQFIMGALGAAVTGAAVSAWPAPAAIAAALAVGSLTGAAWGFIPGALKALTGAHEVVTTIMLNTIATSVIGWLVTGPFLAPGFSFSRTGDIGNAAIPIILGRNLDAGVLLSVIAVPAIWFLLFRSTLGFQIRAVGANPSAARYAGMRPTLIIIFTMSLAGFLFGVAGSVEVLGNTHFVNASYGTTYGFDAITVALLGRTHPVGIVLAALLFGAMRAGSGLMQITTGIPVEMVDVLQAIVLLFIAANVIVRNVFRIRASAGGLAELETVTKSYSSGAVR
jgi:simple sugar transport system permease protein